MTIAGSYVIILCEWFTKNTYLAVSLWKMKELLDLFGQKFKGLYNKL